MIELNDRVYNEAVRIAGEPGQSPDRLGDFAEVTGDRLLVLRSSIILSGLAVIEPFWGEHGEVCLIEPLATWQDVKALQDWSPARKIRSSTVIRSYNR